ncbi:MAG: rhodanese-like domain-containing protein [Cryomorphaceae bacterium]|nr:rhodanese-like domain-containing protein [Cryomorphaceae bacterium]
MRYYLLSLIITMAISGCAQEGTFDEMFKSMTTGSVRVVKPEEITEKTRVVYLDARELNEFQVSHIPGAIHIGYDDFEMDRVSDLPKDALIIVYCSVGYRSEKVGEKLMKAGFRNVGNLYGGIFYWVNSGRQVVNAQGPTRKVHAYNERWGKWLIKAEKVYE